MLIGLCGQSCSGKDTVADYLIRNHSFVRVAFADPMKRFVQDVFEFSDEQVWGPSGSRNADDPRYIRQPHGCLGGTIDHFDEEGKAVVVDSPLHDVFLTPRYALQTLGTEWGRNCYSQVWVDYAIRIHKKLQEGHYGYEQKRGLYSVSFLAGQPEPMMVPKTNVVISDVRFLNEVIGIKNAGGFVFRVKRPGADGNVGIKGHASEEEQKAIHDDMLDGTILNNRDIDHLYEVINRVVIPYLHVKERP